MKKTCENCACCSVGYPSFAITCDIDGHIIKNESTETCESFIEIEE